MAGNSEFKLTYATMFDPPDELHTEYEAAVKRVKGELGKDHPMWIGGEDVTVSEKKENFSPIDPPLLRGPFQRATPQDGQGALEAAQRAARDWGRRPWRERVALVRKAADLITERIFTFGAVLSLEAGKTRMEALADAAEAAALMQYACDQMEANEGFIVEMGKDPLKGYEVTNISKLKPYGVWVVISPFNFPGALTAGPVGTALVAGNTVVYKPAEETPWASRLFAGAFRDAGFPDGVVNYVTGKGSVVGQALIDSPLTAGVTFTGSVDIGMSIYQSFSRGRYPRPPISKMVGRG